VCGISGVFSRNGDAGSLDDLRSMMTQVRHRGPDSFGYWSDGPMRLAHARLSIIDLVGGHQPMSNDSGSLWITFNGEIFNYPELRQELTAAGFHFKTHSDTEVILQMYAAKGERCVEYFNGQWAFAIWDVHARRLFLSRDRIGIRPLFYTQTAQNFLFASEIKSLLAHPEVRRDLDLETLDEVFTFWSGLPGKTMFKGIQELPPGHSMIFENGVVKVWRYWQLDYSPIDSDMNEDYCAEKVLELLNDATRIRLRSDVPVGAYVSGGLDSSVVAALAIQHSSSPPRTFSVAFEDAEFDESVHQQEVTRFLKTDHQSVRCSYQDICDAFPDVIRHTEIPILRTAPAPLYLLSRLVNTLGYKVVLTGEGADEFFGGYDIFKEAKIRRFWATDVSSRSRPLLLRRLYPYLPNLKVQPDSYRTAFFRIGPSEDSHEFFSHLPRWELTAKLKTFFSEDVKAEIKNANRYADLKWKLPDAYPHWDAFSQAQYLEATGLLPGYILSSQGDRMAMAHSVEARFPFLDYRLVEFTCRIPPRLKMKVLNEKYILKRAAAHLVPSSVVKRPKQPYRAPDAASFFDATAGRARADYVEDALAPDRIRKDGFFNPAAVAKLVEKARRGGVVGTKDNMALVGILSTQLLVEHFIRHSGDSRNAVSGTGNSSVHCR
jgi:asparagine synthase (glutamine-hydrolysing)